MVKDYRARKNARLGMVLFAMEDQFVKISRADLTAVALNRNLTFE